MEEEELRRIVDAKLRARRRTAALRAAARNWWRPLLPLALGLGLGVWALSHLPAVRAPVLASLLAAALFAIAYLSWLVLLLSRAVKALAEAWEESERPRRAAQPPADAAADAEITPASASAPPPSDEASG